MSARVEWAYGVTTVPVRRRTTLPKTLASLAAAGFHAPRLFVDGDYDANSWVQEFKLECTAHYPPLRTFGNWVLGLWELYVRSPLCTHYAMFQDDLIMSKNVKEYCSRTCKQEKTYWNLFVFTERPPKGNQHLCPRHPDGRYVDGWYRSNQLGRGAVSLVFSREAVIELLKQQHIVDRPLDSAWGHKKIDGGICEAFKKAGYTEFVHNPSLVQHIGDVSSMGNPPYLPAQEWRGEHFDALACL